MNEFHIASPRTALETLNILNNRQRCTWPTAETQIGPPCESFVALGGGCWFSPMWTGLVVQRGCGNVVITGASL